MTFRPTVQRLESRTHLAVDPIDSVPLAAPVTSVLADLNGDKKADRVTVHRNTAVHNVVLEISLGRGNGTFKGTDRVGFGFNTAVTVAVGDLDGDGLADVAVAGKNLLVASPVDGTFVSTFFGDGQGHFKRTPVTVASHAAHPLVHTTFLPQAASVNGLSLGDLDDNGFGDVAVMGLIRTANAADPSFGIVVAWDPTLPTFAPVPPTVIPFPALTSVDRLFNGDLDGDGKLDLIAARSTPLPPSMLAVVRPDLVTVRFATGHTPTVRAGLNPLYLPSSPPTPTASSANAARTTIGLADIDDDGAPDLVGTAGPATIRYSSFLRATHTFSPAKSAASFGLPARTQLRQVRLADLDGDGLADLLASSNDGPLIGRNVTVRADLDRAAFAWNRVLSPSSEALSLTSDVLLPLANTQASGLSKWDALLV